MDEVVVLNTGQGQLVIEFFSDDAPAHVENFIRLADEGFYDGTLFHRIISGFMIQGGDSNTISGDPDTWGRGVTNWNLAAEFNDIRHDRGIVSMMRHNSPNSAGSQFFIVHRDAGHLDGQYTVFGRLATADSFQTLDELASVPNGSKNEPLDPEQVRITKAYVTSRSEIPDILGYYDPPRRDEGVWVPTGGQQFTNAKYGVAIDIPKGWETHKRLAGDPILSNFDFAAVGPNGGLISVTVHPPSGNVADDPILEHRNELDGIDGLVISGKKTVINGNDAYVAELEYLDDKIKHRHVQIYGSENDYIIAYVNSAENFDSNLKEFEDLLDSLKVVSGKPAIGGSYSVTVDIDRDSYAAGDRIAVQGHILPVDASKTVQLAVFMPDGNSVAYVDEARIESDGSYSHEIIPDARWDQDGTYMIRAAYYDILAPSVMVAQSHGEFEIDAGSAPRHAEPESESSALDVGAAAISPRPELSVPAPFVDVTRDPQYYVDRYHNELGYREWFDDNYSEYEHIYQAVGMEEPSEPESRVDELVADSLCSDHLVPVTKPHVERVLCVKPATAEKLEDRGWVMMPPL